MVEEKKTEVFYWLIPKDITPIAEVEVNKNLSEAERPKAYLDGGYLKAEKDALFKSVLMKHMLEDTHSHDSVPIAIPNVSRVVLQKILEWCQHHVDDPVLPDTDESDSRKKTTDIDEWDQKFMQVDQEMLFEIILGANYLDIKPLLDTGCKTVANMIKGKSPEEIRKTFNITNDFTPEEEDQIRRENEWAEDR